MAEGSTNYLEEYSHSSTPEVFLAAASQRTKNIRLGHGIVQLTTNHPARVAERVATLDLVSDGRVELERAHVDQVIPLNQAGKNTHEDICASLELFAHEVMPEFQGRHGEQEAWKAAVLAGDTVLEDIDTAPFNFAARGKPTKPSSKEARNMISGVGGRPAAEAVG